MPNRVIKSSTRTSTTQLADCLGSLFAIEFLAPSPEIYLFSPWLSNVQLVTNRFGQFRSIMPQLSGTDLRLADILVALAERGTRVRVVYKPDQLQTDDFLRRVAGSVETRACETWHEKGLITEHFYLRGSMNFTYSGVNVNDESVELTTEPHAVALALANAAQQWGTL